MTEKLKHAIVIAFILIMSACQPVATSTGVQKPTPIVKATRTLLATKVSPTAVTPQITPTFTSAPHLKLTPDRLNGVHILFWHPWAGEMAQTMDSLVQEFNQTNTWGISVEIVSTGSSNELYHQVAVGIDNGILPNLVAASMEQFLSWESQSRIMIGLDEYIHNPQWGLNPQELSDITLAFLKQNQIENRLIAIPAERTTQVIFYNKTWGKELGFTDPPVSPDDFKNQACAGTKANKSDTNPDKRGTGGWIVNTDPLIIINWILAFNPDFLKDLQEGRFVFDTPETAQTFTYLRQMLDEDCAWMSRIPTPYEYFANRQTLLYSGSMEDILPQTQAMERLQNGDEWTIIPYPRLGDKPMILSSGTSYGILVDSPEKQLSAWLLIRWLISPQNQARLIESSGSLPISSSSVQLLADFQNNHPQWTPAIMWIPIVQAAPQQSTWRVARSILEDATWQIFQTNVKADEIPAFLKILDDTIAEVIQHK